MLSGIGPAAHLREHGIDVAVDLPGRRAEPPRPPGRADALAHPRHHRHRRGEHAGATCCAGRRAATDRWPPTSARAARSCAPATTCRRRTCRCTSRRPASTTTACTSRWPGCSPPARRWCRWPAAGALRLRSADPTWHPEIDPGYYDDPADLDAMREGCRRILDIVSQGPLAKFLDGAWMPGPNPTDEDLTEHLRRNTQTLYHPVGTCAMGRRRARGRRPAAAGPRRRRAARRRRLGDADRAPRQHQRPHHHGRREGGRRDQEQPMTAHRVPPRSRTRSSPRPGHRRRRRRAPGAPPRPRCARPSSGPARRPPGGGASGTTAARTCCTRWKGVLARRIAQLADVVHRETGKPHSDAIAGDRRSRSTTSPGPPATRRRCSARARSAPGC